MAATISFDGASKGNPGEAAAAFEIVRPNGKQTETVCGGGSYLGLSTNNVAEYTGLIDGLKAARDRGLRNVNVQGDSKLVLNQVYGTWRVKAPHLQPLRDQARELSAAVGIAAWKWVPRAENVGADTLANMAIVKKGSITAQCSEEVVGGQGSASHKRKADDEPSREEPLSRAPAPAPASAAQQRSHLPQARPAFQKRHK